MLLLHGGGGPLTVQALGERIGAQVPVHPGFAGTPQTISTIGDLAEHYLSAHDKPFVIGSSIGGWIAAEMAIRGELEGLVIIDGVGLQVDGHPVVDFFSLTPQEIAERSFYGPMPPIKPDSANLQALKTYAPAMEDPTLAERLQAVDVPALVVWGEADRIADPDYGRAYAAAIPGADFTLIERAGHLPQLERPDALLDALQSWERARLGATRGGSLGIFG